MNQSINQNPKLKILFFSLLILINGIIIGILICRNLHKEQPNIVYDINHISDSINAANAKIDTNITKQETIIIHEKIKLKEIFTNIDSISYDSAFRYWANEARYYKPLFD